jgi:hydroxyethylthiazole kinase-like uncharacterized protein yjeF
MRVCTSREMAAIDSQTIAGGVPGAELMERAGRALTEVLWDFLSELDVPRNPAVLIVCGKGNNGGDGLVMARLLQQNGAEATVLLLAPASELSPDAALNLECLPDEVTVETPERRDWVEAFQGLVSAADVLVDAVFGTGITPPLREPYISLIRAMNGSRLPCLAVDIPSGVDGDTGLVDPVAVRADLTVTVGLPKRGLLLQPGRDFRGELEVVDIGFPDEICLKNTREHHCLGFGDYVAMLPPRPADTHKYRTGTLLLVAGSHAYGGAAHLAALGALRSGAGLVTAAIPRCLEVPLRTALPEAIVAPLAETSSGTLAPLAEPAWSRLCEGKKALALGPGLDANPDTDSWVREILARLEGPAVIDADGLGTFARGGAEPSFQHAEVVLTPHAGELARLTGLTSAQVEEQKFELVCELAARWQVVLMLKGSTTLVGTPGGRLYFNPGGCDALARGGSGDVLTGLIGGLLAQGLPAAQAALLGAFLHGQAGTLAAVTAGSRRAVRVTETANALGQVFASMEQAAAESESLLERIRPVRRGENR